MIVARTQSCVRRRSCSFLHRAAAAAHSSTAGHSVLFKAASVTTNDGMHRNNNESSSSSSSSSSGLFQLLKDSERAILDDQKKLTEKCKDLTKEVGLASSKYTMQNKNRLQDFNAFSVVIAGEYNAGKSTLINALLGQKLLETGSLPTTDCITILSHPADRGEDSSGEGAPEDVPGVVRHTVNLPLLQDLTLVDTPGTNAVVTDHTAITLGLLPEADLILFCTSADRPFPESERQLLESIAAYRKSIVILINKMDVLEDTGGVHGGQEKQRVHDFVTEHSSSLLGARPIIISVSARDALAAKLTRKTERDSAVWNRSNFSALESFLQDTLTTATKIKSKLSNPVGIAEGIVDECTKKIKRQKKDLETDVATLNLLNSQFLAWRKELESDMDHAASEMQNIIVTESKRGSVLLQRLTYFDYFDGIKLRQEMLNTKSALSHEQTIQRELLDLVADRADSIATCGRAQGQAVVEFLGTRPATMSKSLVGTITAASSFTETRNRLAERMGRAVSRSIYVDESVTQNILIERLYLTAWVSGGLTLGMLVNLVALSSSYVGLYSGISSLCILCLSNGILLTSGRKYIVQQYGGTWLAQAGRLDEDIKSIYTKEGEHVARRIKDGVTPYTRFVEVEQEKLDRLSNECESLALSARALRKRIMNIV